MIDIFRGKELHGLALDWRTVSVRDPLRLSQLFGRGGSALSTFGQAVAKGSSSSRRREAD
jgi:hypothetical protein